MNSMFAMLSIALLAVCAVGAVRAEDKPGAQRVFEMRTYYAAPGKMDAMHTRFRDHTNKLFVKHGMQMIGYWVPTDADKANVMVYILAYPSREAATTAWKNFREDPVWIKAKTESEVNGKLVDKLESVFMNPTDYSAIK